MNLKTARMLRGISTVQLANVMGFTKQRYGYIERTGLEHCREETARKVAKTLNFSLFELCDIEKLLMFVPKTEEEWDTLIAMAQKAKEKCGK